MSDIGRDMIAEQNHRLHCENNALRCRIKELEEENKSLREDGMTIYAMMNDERVDALKAKLSRYEQLEKAARNVFSDHIERFTLYPDKEGQPHKLQVMEQLHKALIILEEE